MSLQLTNTRITVGLPTPVKILHTTDVHLTYANAEDTPEHHELMARRTATFYEEGERPEHTPEEFFREAIALAKSEGVLHVCTGDAIDIHTRGNLEKFMEITDGEDLMFSPGGHEHQRVCVRTMEEPYPYVETVRPQLEGEYSRWNLYLESRVVDGLNIVTADNSLDYYDRRTLEAFKRELEKGLPIIVFSHDPLWTKLLHCTEPYHPNVRLTPEDYRVSHEMIDLLKSHPLVVTTIAGHGHYEDEKVIEGKTHYMTAGLFKGAARMIEVV